MLPVMEPGRQKKLKTFVCIKNHWKRKRVMPYDVPIVCIRDVFHNHLGGLKFFLTVGFMAYRSSGCGGGIGSLCNGKSCKNSENRNEADRKSTSLTSST